MQSTNVTPTTHHVKEPLSIQGIGELLIKHYKLHQGLYDVSVEFGVGFGAVGPSQEAVVPGVVIGVQRIGLTEVQVKGQATLDASIVNPKKASRS